ncbi:MAG: tetratricopeptide repeat protein [Phycisphaeraceae bacterium]|nr:tetratricopeptide repeat protein [Phycisphaeraceae bacterium]
MLIRPPQITDPATRSGRCALAIAAVAAAWLALPAVEAFAQGGVPSRAPRPMPGIVPSRTPPLERVPSRPLPTGPTLRPGERPDHRPIVVFPPGYGWRFDRPRHFDPDFISSSGLTVTGSVGTDHWRVRFRLGSPVINRSRDWYWWRYPYWGFSHWAWWNTTPRWAIGGWWDYTDQFLDFAGQLEQQRAADELRRREQAERDRFARLSELERGDERLSQGRAQDAVNHYLRHLETAPDDTEAMRSLAVALIDANRIDHASAVFAMAYERTPSLVRQPMDSSRFPGTATDLRSRLTSLVHYANRTGAASAWLSAAVLAQAEGRDPAARNMLGRARTAGLNSDLVSAFESALGTR